MAGLFGLSSRPPSEQLDLERRKTKSHQPKIVFNLDQFLRSPSTQPLDHSTTKRKKGISFLSALPRPAQQPSSPDTYVQDDQPSLRYGRQAQDDAQAPAGTARARRTPAPTAAIQPTGRLLSTLVHILKRKQKRISSTHVLPSPFAIFVFTTTFLLILAQQLQDLF